LRGSSCLRFRSCCFAGAARSGDVALELASSLCRVAQVERFTCDALCAKEWIGLDMPTWDPSFETGNASIDRQHKELLELVAELQTEKLQPADQHMNLKMLDAVMDFTMAHFDMEEALMTAVHYPRPDHIEMTEQHAEFRSYARLRVMEFHFDPTVNLSSFVPYLRRWLIGHEFGLDAKLADYIRRTGQ